MEKEAYLYREFDQGKVLCLTCQRKCIITESQKGWCQTRENKGGKLYSLIYGEVSILSINPHFYMSDLPFPSGALSERCLKAAQEAGLTNVRIGNVHLLA
jgi:hypothetical protein